MSSWKEAAKSREFEEAIRKFGQKAQRRASDVHAKVCLDLFGRIVMRTPVDTGRLRGAWAVDDGRAEAVADLAMDIVAADEPPANQGGGGASPTKARILAAIVEALARDPFRPMTLSNNLPYAVPIEYGHSDQAPAGMVRVSVAEFQDIARIAVRGLRDE